MRVQELFINLPTDGTLASLHSNILLSLLFLLVWVQATELRSRSVSVGAIAFCLLIGLVVASANRATPFRALGGMLTVAPAFVLASLRRPESIGDGDIWLALGIGMMLGPADAAFSVAAGCLGALTSHAQSVRAGDRETSSKAGIRFAPFLVAGAILAHLT